MSSNDDTEARRKRLRALRDKHPQGADIGGLPESIDSDDSSVEPRSEVGGAMCAGGGEGKRRGGLGGKRGRKGARRGQGAQRNGGGSLAGAGEGRGDMLKRLHGFLTQPGPGGRLIPGTAVKEDRLKQVMQFLRHRGNSDDGKQSKRLQRVIGFLTREEDGVELVAGVNPQQLQRFSEILEARIAAPAEDGGDELEGVFDELIAEDKEEAPVEPVEPVEPLESEEAAEAETTPTLEELMNLTQRLSSQLEETQRQMASMMGSNTAAQESTGEGAGKGAEKETQKKPGKGPNADWFSEFLE